MIPEIHETSTNRLTDFTCNLFQVTEESPQTTDDVEAGWMVLRDIILGSNRGGKEKSAEGSAVCEVAKEESALPKPQIKTPPRLALQAACKMFDEWSSPK